MPALPSVTNVLDEYTCLRPLPIGAILSVENRREEIMPVLAFGLIGPLGTPEVVVIAAVLVLQLAFIFAPFLNTIFGSSPIAPGDLGLVTLVGASILPVISVEKWWRNREAKSPLKG